MGYHISDTTVGNVRKQHGIEPAPDRKCQTTGKTFIKSHWDVLSAIDFTTVDVWTKGGLITVYLLFVMELATRRVHLAACLPTLGDDFMKQVARNLTDPFDGALKDMRYVLMDRDSNFSCAFRTILTEADVEPIRLPARSPNLNSHLERSHLSLRSECLDRMIVFGERSLRNAVGQFLVHYHGERNHQTLNNTLIDPAEPHAPLIDNATYRYGAAIVFSMIAVGMLLAAFVSGGVAFAVHRTFPTCVSRMGGQETKRFRKWITSLYQLVRCPPAVPCEFGLAAFHDSKPLTNH